MNIINCGTSGATWPQWSMYLIRSGMHITRAVSPNTPQRHRTIHPSHHNSHQTRACVHAIHASAMSEGHSTHHIVHPSHAHTCITQQWSGGIDTCMSHHTSHTLRRHVKCFSIAVLESIGLGSQHSAAVHVTSSTEVRCV